MSGDWQTKTRQAPLVLGDRDAERAVEFRRLVEGGDLVRLARAAAVFEDDDAIALGPQDRAIEHHAPIIHRLADPDAAQMIDVDAGGVDQHRLGGEQLDLQAIGDGHGGDGLLRRHLGQGGDGNQGEND